MITDAQHGKAIPQAEEIEHRAKNLVRPLLDDAQVPVMGGFIGATEQGVQTTIGRGGSDFSAALIGAGLDAEAIEIWTDVDGMMTTDPRICPEARRIRVISFEEAAELAYFGAKVLHPATVLPAVQKDIPVLVLNSLNPCKRGHADRRPRPALEIHLQGHCRQEAHHHRRGGRRPHAGRSWIPQGHLRRL